MDEKLQAGLMQALDDVRAATRQDGNEHLIVLDRIRGTRLLQVKGDRDKVTLDHSTIDRKAALVVHSHPGETPLSLGDMTSALSNKSPVYAVTPDSWVSWIDGQHGPNLPGPDLFEIIGDDGLRAYYKKMKAAGYRVPLASQPTYKPDEEWALGLQAHYLNIALDKLKMIHYRWSMLPASLERLDADTLRIFGPDWNKGKSWATHASYRALPIVE